MITIGIVGYGYVGKAVYNYLSTHYNIIYYDPFYNDAWNKELMKVGVAGVGFDSWHRHQTQWRTPVV